MRPSAAIGNLNGSAITASTGKARGSRRITSTRPAITISAASTAAASTGVLGKVVAIIDPTSLKVCGNGTERSSWRNSTRTLYSPGGASAPWLWGTSVVYPSALRNTE